MKSAVKTILILSILTGFASQSFAQSISADKFRAIVQKQALKDLQKYNLDEAEVTVGHLPVTEFNLPDGKITVEIVANTNSLVAKEYRKVNVKVNNVYSKTYYAPIETKAFKYAAVAKEMIQREKVISPQAVEFKKVNVVGNLNNTLSLDDLAREVVASKVFYPGELITKRYTTSKPDIVKNAMVTVNFKTGQDLTITIEGIALTQGNIGDTIQIKNKRFNRIYTGEITGTNRVLVQI